MKSLYRRLLRPVIQELVREYLTNLSVEDSAKLADEINKAFRGLGWKVSLTPGQIREIARLVGEWLVQQL